MKNLILSLILILLSCKNNENKIYKTELVLRTSLSDTTKKNNDGNRRLDELNLPYCFKIDTLPKSNYYQTNLDTFLIHHNLKRNKLLEENNRFHKNTIDFDGLNTYSLSLEDLIINKSSTQRAKDKLDLEQLKELSKISK